MQQLQQFTLMQQSKSTRGATVDNEERNQRDQRLMAEAVVDKTWQVPAYEGVGPVTMALRVPEVRITDSEGRYVIISPRQSELVSARMSDINDWLRYGDSDYDSTE